MKGPDWVSEYVVNEFLQIFEKMLGNKLVEKKDDHVILSYTALHWLLFFIHWCLQILTYTYVSVA